MLISHSILLKTNKLNFYKDRFLDKIWPQNTVKRQLQICRKSGKRHPHILEDTSPKNTQMRRKKPNWSFKCGEREKKITAAEMG